KYYAVSRYRTLSELGHVRNPRYNDLWEGLMDSFRLFEDERFGGKLGIKPLGGVLFNEQTLENLKNCEIGNDAIFDAFRALNLFSDENGQLVKINYSSLDVEEFGSVYEGILEKRPLLIQGLTASDWSYGFVGGLDRQSTSSYYTRPDLVQSLIRTTLEPVIKERLSKLRTPEEKVASLLSMKVCDAASGSGHIVLAMARTIAWYVSSIRSGEDNPASIEYRRALHEVIQKCVYAVDYNPDAVELCKVVLWIEGYCAGMPLSFLDHHIRCGNSVVGVTDLDTLLEGVPDKAFNAEDRDTLKAIKGLNKKALKDIKLIKDGKGNGLAISLFREDFNISKIDEEQISLAEEVREITTLPENNLLEQLTKQRRWEDLMQSPRVESLRRAGDIFTTAFYHTFTYEDVHAGEDSLTLPNSPYTATVYQALEEIKQLENPDSNYVPLNEEFKRYVADTAARQRFFHWCVEFPEVFADGGGFDVMCGNPPWDKIKVEDKKWFERQGRMDIVNAGTAAQRKKAIEALRDGDRSLYYKYQQANADAEAMSRFVRFGGRFPLTATGDIDLYPMFAELCLQFSKEAWGLVLPIGIAVNDSNKAFFSKLVDENRLISMYGFENEEKIFESIAHDAKFCLLTAGTKLEKSRLVTGGFYLRRLDHLLDSHR
ncbi:MAG: restriction endonuclease, partial [Muribaculaceae bacterium]|nr:restriction endonuclease [Muribaculaceae bacterium]